MSEIESKEQNLDLQKQPEIEATAGVPPGAPAEAPADAKAIDPSEYTYDPSVGVRVPVEFFNALGDFFLTILEKETETKYELPPHQPGVTLTPQDLMKEKKSYVSQEGLNAAALMSSMQNLHIRNIEDGIAIHVSELKPKVELVK